VNGLTGSRVDLEQPIATVQENKKPSTVAPESRPSQLPAAARKNLAQLVGFAVETPELAAGFSIERGDAVVGRRDVQNAIDH
jgi:hypothetical protein